MRQAQRGQSALHRLCTAHAYVETKEMKLVLRAAILRSAGDVHGRRVAKPTGSFRFRAARRVPVVAAASTKLQDGLLQAGGWSLQEEGTVYGEGFLVNPTSAPTRTCVVVGRIGSDLRRA